MAFRLVDVKKTVRSRSDGHRYIHPRLLEGPSVTAQAGLALAYLHSRLGRVRREVDPETLVRFFGDPKVARGLMACLTMTYRWRTQEFAEVLPPRDVARLARRGILNACDLRLYLYDRLNREAGGFLDAPRPEQIAPLAARLGLNPAKLDQLIALDADDNAVLVRVGPPPEPEQVVALYNFQVVDALLRHSATVELHGLCPAALDALRRAARDAGVTLEVGGSTAVLRNEQDVFGSYARAGTRLVRALYAAAACDPTILTAGFASVVLPGKGARYELSRDTLKALTAGSKRVRAADAWNELRPQWTRWRAAQGVDGWRLETSPEPVVSAAGLALAPFAARRGETRVLLWPTGSTAGLADAAALTGAGVAVLPVGTEGLAGSGEHAPALVDGGQGIEALVAALSEGWGGERVSVAAQALDGLLHDLDAEGFIAETRVLETLQCATARELAGRLRVLDPARAVYVDGLGLCSAGFAAGMRKGLRRKPAVTPAA